uniref:Cysteine dioxygenase n=1 Tax=Timema monikensis TaxID=170555 RepID=A0A7R9HQY6_9NEOP|nr:unnamed protein product [Timema monikensis]
MDLRMSIVSCFSLGEAHLEADVEPRSLHSVGNKSSHDVYVVWSLVVDQPNGDRIVTVCYLFRYTRNLVDQGNGKFNLMILCWGEGHGSAIHDHADSHCFMKVLQGSLSEVRFSWPEDSPSKDDDNLQKTGGTRELNEICRNSLRTNDVCYINDSLGIHRVENTSHTERAVSLHLYCPPFDTCSVFNQNTGRRSKCQVTFWSKFGDKRNRKRVSFDHCPCDYWCGLSRYQTSVTHLVPDSLGIHRVENTSHTERAVSLHLYCPPFDTCSVFNQNTGRRSKCQVTFWSKFGDKRNRFLQGTSISVGNSPCISLLQIRLLTLVLALLSHSFLSSTNYPLQPTD